MHERGSVGGLVPLAVKALPHELLARPSVLAAPTWPHTTTTLAWCYEFTRFASFRYGLPLPTYSIVFAQLNGHAGQVSDRENTFLITLDERFESDTEVLAHILAHELAHLLLNRTGIRAEPLESHERLTDAVAVLAGFGPVMLTGKERSRFTTSPSGYSVHTTRVGYLSQDELGWLIEIRHYLGARYTWPRKSIDRRRHETCACAVCSTRLRLPDLRATIDLQCPACLLKQRVLLQDGSPLEDALRRLWRWIRSRNLPA